MNIDVEAPALGDPETPATLGSWKKSVGDHVEEGELLVDLEDQKTTYEIVAPTTGTLIEVLAEDNAEVRSEQVLAHIECVSEAASAPSNDSASRVEICVPSLREPESGATVGVWRKGVGDRVQAGDILLDVEEQKTTYEIEAPTDGVLQEILRFEGEEVADEALLAIIIADDRKSDTTAQDESESVPLGEGLSAAVAGTSTEVPGSPDRSYDVIVIGAGPGGYACAIRCAQLGLKTACVDKRLNEAGKPALGGTCLNVGCIPSKALLDSSHRFSDLKHHSADHGIQAENIAVDVHKLMGRKENIVDSLVKGIEFLFKKNGVSQFTGSARLAGRNEVKIQTADGETINLYGKFIVVATGSEPAAIPAAPFDGEHVVDSAGAMSFDSVPERLGVVGAGAIGLELGSVWARLGSQVVLLEALDTFLPAVDSDVSSEALKVFGRQGLDVRLGACLNNVQVCENGLALSYTSQGETRGLIVDKLIVSVGRRPYTAELGADRIGLAMDARGYIEVDEHCRTRMENVFAIGDVVRGPMLAHKAEREGVTVAELIAGETDAPPSTVVPGVVYTWPEIAWVGKSEQELKSENCSYRIGTFPFRASGRALAAGETDGMVKVLVEESTNRLLGVHIFGPQASELIAEAVNVLSVDGSVDGLTRGIHAHPTLSEAVHEAALKSESAAVHV